MSDPFKDPVCPECDWDTSLGNHASHCSNPFAVIDSVTLSVTDCKSWLDVMPAKLYLTYIVMNSYGFARMADEMFLILDGRCVRCRYNLTHLAGDCMACHGERTE